MSVSSEHLEARSGSRWWIWISLVIVGGIIAWALRFTFGYLLTPLSCDVGKWLQYVISAVFILAGAGVIAINARLLRRVVRPERFLLFVGLGLNIFFVAVMLLEVTSIIASDPCAKGAIP